ncbi:MAG: hypothetical protein ACOZCO_06905 [Bacteroidota bacterium]
MRTVAIIIIFILTSCGDYNYYFNKIKGTYTVDELVYNNASYKHNMISNIMSFHENKDCFLPSLSHSEYEGIGSWDIEIGKEPVIKIETNYYFFQGEYKITFNEDKEFTRMVLSSENVEIHLTKIID